MFTFQIPRRRPKDVEAEIQSLCRDQQMRHLSLAVRKDVGLDCGCQQPSRLVKWG